MMALATSPARPPAADPTVAPMSGTAAVPSSAEKARIAVKLSAEDAAKCFTDIRAFGQILKEEWMPSGAWVGVVEMPAGMQTDFLERLNAKTKGNVETRVLKADQRV